MDEDISVPAGGLGGGNSNCFISAAAEKQLLEFSLLMMSASLFWVFLSIKGRICDVLSGCDFK